MLDLSDLFDHVNINDSNKHIEIEVKFKIKPQYKLIQQYNRLLTFMQQHYPETIEESTVISYPNDIRVINGIVERKKRLKDYHKYTNDYGFMISISEESPANLPPNLKSTNVRKRYRHIFNLDDYELDLTEVNNYYEIELEYLGDYKNIDLNLLEEKILFIYKILTQSENFVTQTQLTNLINETNQLFNVAPQKNISKKILVNARNIKFIDLTYGGIVGGDIGYVVSHKADGLRHLLIVNYIGIWLVSNTINLLVKNKDIKPSPDKKTFIYECEVIQNENYIIAVYDCLVYQNENIMDQDIYERTSSIPSLIELFNKLNLSNITMFHKTFKDLTLDNFFIVMREMFEEQKELFYPQDGFIFTPNGKYNYHSDDLPIHKRTLLSMPDVCKWKPPTRITIDFRVLNGQLLVYNVIKKKEEPFTGSFIYNISDISNEFNEPQYQNKIVETEYDLVCNLLKPLKIRHDKDGPNRLDIASANWDDLHDYISQEDLEGKTLTLVKKYHNQIKNILYHLPTQYPPFNIEIENYNLLDIGSGRGGDLGKWQKSKVNQVIVVEPNLDNLNELYERLETSNVNVETINTVGEDTLVITNKVKETFGKADVVSLMLSLSFFWASEAHLDALINTIASNLKLNGYVIFLTIDHVKFGEYNEASFTDYNQGDHYGHFVLAEISGIVGKQWEFVVHLEDLTEKLKNVGIELIEKRPATDELLLDEKSKAYTSMFTYGYYQKVKEVKPKIGKKLPIITYPKINELNYDEVAPIYGLMIDMVKIGCSDLIDAILKSYHEEYQNGIDREEIRKTFRQDLASSIQNNWATFNQGYFPKKLLNQVSQSIKNIESNIDYTSIGLQYYLNFENDILPLLSYIAYMIDIDIFIFKDLKLIQSTFSCLSPKTHFIMIDGKDLLGQNNNGIQTLFDIKDLYKLKLPYYSFDEILISDVKTLFGPTKPNLSIIIKDDYLTKMIESVYTNVDIYVNALLKNISKVYKLPAPKTPAYEMLKNDVQKLFENGNMEDFLKFKKIPKTEGRVEERIDTITNILDQLNFKIDKVIDIGAGKGDIIKAVKNYYGLPKSNVYAIDQKLPNIKDITTLTYKDGKIPLPDQSVNLILMFAVLHHIPLKERLDILNEVKRILVPGGLVIIREHDDDLDPNFTKFIDLIHQFWYISENEKEDPLFLMTHDDILKLFNDIGLKSVYYNKYENPNPQHIYHEVFQSVYDDFPYKKYSMNLADIDKRFNRLKNYKFETVRMPYKIRNIPGDWYDNPKLKYNQLLIVNKETDYLNYNLISDYFSDSCRMIARRYDQPLSPIEYWQQNKDYVKQQAKKIYGKIDAYTLRETIYKLAGEVTDFRSSVMVGFIKMFNAKRILDPSSGWSPRLIGALAMNVEYYVGVDPNTCLHPKYKEIINYFPSKTKAIMIQAPFEEAILPDLTYDLILTSFPYFDLEIYTDEPTQSITNKSLSEWFDNYLLFSMIKAWEKLEKGGHMVIIINDIKDKANYVKSMVDIFTDITKDAEYLGVISYTELINNKPKNPQPCWIWKKK